MCMGFHGNGGVRKKKRGRERDGRTYDEMPVTPEFAYNARIA
ncbi:MAG: hypothetical protein V9G20_16330 [Candidatus Promineifilaceae bacterium]